MGPREVCVMCVCVVLVCVCVCVRVGWPPLFRGTAGGAEAPVMWCEAPACYHCARSCAPPRVAALSAISIHSFSTAEASVNGCETRAVRIGIEIVQRYFWTDWIKFIGHFFFPPEGEIRVKAKTV